MWRKEVHTVSNVTSFYLNPSLIISLLHKELSRTLQIKTEQATFTLMFPYSYKTWWCLNLSDKNVQANCNGFRTHAFQLMWLDSKLACKCLWLFSNRVNHVTCDVIDMCVRHNSSFDFSRKQAYYYDPDTRSHYLSYKQYILYFRFS